MSNSTNPVFAFVLALFQPKDPIWFARVLITVNFAVFVSMFLSGVDVMSPSISELLAWGANEKNHTFGGEWWRLVTSMFLHGGVLHLLFNMYGLYVAASIIEPMVGKRKMILLYMSSGVLASVASATWNEYTVSVGASGAIFGLFGFLLALLSTSLFPSDIKMALLRGFAPYIALSLGLGLFMNFDNAAHLGGLFSGLGFGFIWLVFFSSSVKARIKRYHTG